MIQAKMDIKECKFPVYNDMEQYCIPIKLPNGYFKMVIVLICLSIVIAFSFSKVINVHIYFHIINFDIFKTTNEDTPFHNLLIARKFWL